MSNSQRKPTDQNLDKSEHRISQRTRPEMAPYGCIWVRSARDNRDGSRKESGIADDKNNRTAMKQRFLIHIEQS
jgi:hypothetical protein